VVSDAEGEAAVSTLKDFPTSMVLYKCPYCTKYAAQQSLDDDPVVKGTGKDWASCRFCGWRFRIDNTMRPVPFKEFPIVKPKFFAEGR